MLIELDDHNCSILIYNSNMRRHTTLKSTLVLCTHDVAISSQLFKVISARETAVYLLLTLAVRLEGALHSQLGLVQRIEQGVQEPAVLPITLLVLVQVVDTRHSTCAILGAELVEDGVGDEHCDDRQQQGKRDQTR